MASVGEPKLKDSVDRGKGPGLKLGLGAWTSSCGPWVLCSEMEVLGTAAAPSMGSEGGWMGSLLPQC